MDNMEEEIWKDIPGFDGKYRVYNTGKITSTVKGLETILKVSPLSINARGQIRYPQITIGFEGHRETYKMHRLVAILFVPNPENKPEVNHKDGNKSNHHSSNLEWNTHAENVQHAYDTGLLKSYLIGHKPINSHPIIAIKDTAISEFQDYGSCSRTLNIDFRTFKKHIDTNIPYRGFLFFSPCAQ